jgi:hypothetical protein
MGYVSTSASKMVIFYGLLSTTTSSAPTTDFWPTNFSNQSLLERASADYRLYSIIQFFYKLFSSCATPMPASLIDVICVKQQ